MSALPRTGTYDPMSPLSPANVPEGVSYEQLVNGALGGGMSQTDAPTSALYNMPLAGSSQQGGIAPTQMPTLVDIERANQSVARNFTQPSSPSTLPFMNGGRGTTGGMVESPNMTGTGTVMMPAGAQNLTGVSNDSSNDSSGGFNLNLNPMDLLGMFTGDYLADSAADDFMRLGTEAANSAQILADEVAQQTEFKPFTVKTGTGSTLTTDAQGGFTVGLSPEEQARQDAMLAQAGTLFDFAATDPSQATQGMYDVMRQIQRPEEQREALALEERMLSQGRLGLQSSAYGGANPETLAQAQAVEANKLKSLLGAREQSMAERKQAYDSGLGMLTGAYTPQEQALAALGYGIEGGKLADIGRRSGAEFYGQAGQTGIEAMLNASKLAASLEASGRAGLAQDIFGEGGLFSNSETPELDFNFDFNNPDLSDSAKLSKALEYVDVLKNLGDRYGGSSGNVGEVIVEEIVT